MHTTHYTGIYNIFGSTIYIYIYICIYIYIYIYVVCSVFVAYVPTCKHTHIQLYLVAHHTRNLGFEGIETKHICIYTYVVYYCICMCMYT